MTRDGDQIQLGGADYTAWQCGVCGVFAVTPTICYQHMRENGGFPICTNGHKWGWREGGSENARLRQERDRLAQKIAENEDRHREEMARLEAARRAAVNKATKLCKRVAAGVCPCCNRTFANLARHMATKHPGEGSSA